MFHTILNLSQKKLRPPAALQEKQDLHVLNLAPEEISNWDASNYAQKISLIMLDLDLFPADSFSKDEIYRWKLHIQNLLLRCTNQHGKTPAIVAYSSKGTWEKAKQAIKLGARDLCHEEQIENYLLEKLWGKGKAKNSQDPNNIIAFPKAKNEKSKLLLNKNRPIIGVDGMSESIQHARSKIRKCASLEVPVLIIGEVGSGKAQVALSIHLASPRCSSSFVAIECQNLNSELFEAELFGYKKGAFTGAYQDSQGFIQKASGGTLFIDNIDELNLEQQGKLLRVLQNKTFYPLGSNKELKSDFRLICSSKTNLHQLLLEKKIRKDLLFRINIFEIMLPNLKDRQADIPELASHFLNLCARQNNRTSMSIQDEAIALLLKHSWPGNLHELKACIEYALLESWSREGKDIKKSDLPMSILRKSKEDSKKEQLKKLVGDFERRCILDSIERHGGSKEKAAEDLGLSLASLYRKIA